MAEPRDPWIPDPPAGLHGPSIPDSGHILDPAVRREIRELLVPALKDAFRQLAGELMAGGTRPPFEKLMPQPPAGAPPLPAVPAPPVLPSNLAAPVAPVPPLPTPGTPQFPGPDAADASQALGATATGPFPHGDLDLSHIPANVAPPAFPPRRGSARRFYFLDGRDQPHKGG